MMASCERPLGLGLVGRPAAHPREVALSHVLDVDEDLVPALLVPNLAPGIARVAQDRTTQVISLDTRDVRFL
jgi:hypothetical protein